MAQIKSGVTFFRKQLGFRGRSEHNGRGVYEMEMLNDDYDPVDAGVIIARAREVAKKLVEENKVDVEEDGTFLTITIKSHLVDNPHPNFLGNAPYTTLSVGLRYGQVGVVF
jgi:hypothetical protein